MPLKRMQNGLLEANNMNKVQYFGDEIASVKNEIDEMAKNLSF